MFNLLKVSVNIGVSARSFVFAAYNTQSLSFLSLDLGRDVIATIEVKMKGSDVSTIHREPFF